MQSEKDGTKKKYDERENTKGIFKSEKEDQARMTVCFEKAVREELIIPKDIFNY